MTAALSLVVEPAVLQQVQQALALAYPQEGCGLLGGQRDGRGWRITECAMARNQSDRATRQFEIDGLWYARTEKAWAERGMVVQGIVHSHPDCPAIPSETDRVHATNWPGFVWWIVRVDVAGPVESRAWLLSDTERFTEVQVAA